MIGLDGVLLIVRFERNIPNILLPTLNLSGS
jgi:hypothetical protein